MRLSRFWGHDGDFGVTIVLILACLQWLRINPPSWPTRLLFWLKCGGSRSTSCVLAEISLHKYLLLCVVGFSLLLGFLKCGCLLLRVQLYWVGDEPLVVADGVSFGARKQPRL
jgi:hypothetical protein